MGRNRFVLLGASNLTLSLRIIIQQIQRTIRTPSEFLVAAGHGRSYGQFSKVMVRGLPGIKDCGLWQQLKQENVGPTHALITDIGNDIPYEYSTTQILDWISQCVTDLQKQNAQIVMTNIPLQSIECLSERRYVLLRNLLYPYCQLSKTEVVRRAGVIHQALVEMAQIKQFRLLEQTPEWFGLDGIHVGFWKRDAYYRQVVNHFKLDSIGDLDDSGKLFVNNGWKKRPQFQYQTYFDRRWCCPQPSGQFFDDSPISLF